MRTTLTWTLASDIYQPESVKGEARPDRALSFTGRYQSREAAERAAERIFGPSGTEHRVVADLVGKKRDDRPRSRHSDEDA